MALQLHVMQCRAAGEVGGSATPPSPTLGCLACGSQLANVPGRAIIASAQCCLALLCSSSTTVPVVQGKGSSSV
jgi:hypothetical protein